ncbi:hypothetical protein [Phycicoccus sonneratiae]|uniref:Uncharacterized protein n=1 Tax=Phycicoccus sonneratiae TaxID=2807628 RepID=A0ABS2CK74_9MICO|nr:hypothetical protein [Phycicoccus sonneraticus]MBM6400277.1 hypothetical protein [Phycicoccus sonneraticus]
MAKFDPALMSPSSIALPRPRGCAFFALTIIGGLVFEMHVGLIDCTQHVVDSQMRPSKFVLVWPRVASTNVVEIRGTIGTDELLALREQMISVRPEVRSLGDPVQRDLY